MSDLPGIRDDDPDDPSTWRYAESAQPTDPPEQVRPGLAIVGAMIVIACLLWAAWALAG